jgi:hypothetical protein
MPAALYHAKNSNSFLMLQAMDNCYRNPREEGYWRSERIRCIRGEGMDAENEESVEQKPYRQLEEKGPCLANLETTTPHNTPHNQYIIYILSKMCSFSVLLAKSTF